MSMRKLAITSAVVLIMSAEANAWAQNTPKAPVPDAPKPTAPTPLAPAAMNPPKEVAGEPLVPQSDPGVTAIAKDIVALQKQGNELSEEVNTVKNEQQDAKGTVEELRAGKLIASGVTGGIALALQFTSPWNNGEIKQKSPGVTAMPYVLLLPAYWGTPEAHRIACASSWNGGDDHTVDVAARAVARKKAERIFKGIEAELRAKPSLTNQVIVEKYGIEYGSGGGDAVNAHFVGKVRNYAKLNPTSKEARDLKDSIIDSMTYVDWHAGKSGRCWTKKLGLWVGLPINFDASVAFSAEKTPAMHTITPKMAFGLAFAPNAYFTLLLGTTFSIVEREGSTSKPTETAIWSTTLAIGGNLDIATALSK